MIHSMTGFGSATFQVEAAGFELEVRSVNHRHLDARVRVPRPLATLEAPLRARIQERLDRGKVDCTLSAVEGGAPLQRLVVDRDAAREYLQAARELGRAEGIGGELSVEGVLSLPGVSRFAERDLPSDALSSAALAALDRALDGLLAMRASEGASLESDLAERLDRIDDLARRLEERAGEVASSVREKLRRRAKQLESETGLLDEARLHQEVTIAADRLDVTEEIVRLRSHTAQFRESMQGAGVGKPVGRRLDFLLQELGREANTIGSKGADAPIAHLIVDLKTELERIREQVQNVE